MYMYLIKHWHRYVINRACDQTWLLCLGVCNFLFENFFRCDWWFCLDLFRIMVGVNYTLNTFNIMEHSLISILVLCTITNGVCCTRFVFLV